MNPSYDSSFGSFSSGGTTSGGNAQQPIVLNNEKRKKPIKKIIITILLITLIIGGIVLAIVLFLGGKQRAKDEAEELHALLSSSTYSDSSGQCSLVTQNVDNANRTKDEYKEMLNECQTKSDRMMALLNSFDNKFSTEEYRQLYTNLKSLVASRVSTGDVLKEKLATYETWHDYKIALDAIDYYQTPEEIEKIAKPLLELGSEELSQYAQQWIEKRKALVGSYIFAEGFSDDEEYADQYSRALEDYNLLIGKEFSEVAEDMMLKDGEKDSSFSKALYLFNNYMKVNL